MTDPNMHDPQEQPEYGAYDRSHYDRNRDEAQTPRYFDNPYGNPYMAGGNQGQDGSWQPVSPFKLVEEWLPQLLTVGGVIVLKNAALSGATLAVLITMVVGLGWMMEGVMALVESWRMPSSGWAVVYALLSIVAGFIVLFSPVSSTAWLILFGGCALIVLGVVAIVRAFTFGKPRRR